MDVGMWMKERDYWQGVELFCTLSDSTFLKDLFRGGKNKYNEQKLYDELLKFDNQESKQIEEIEDSPKESVEEKKYQNQFLLTKLEQELKQVYRQIDSNRFALKRCKSNATRRDYAFQILNLVDKKRDIYANIDYFYDHGSLPELNTQKKSFTTPELQRLYVQVWKLRKRLEKPDEDLRNRAKSQQKLNEKLARIEQLKGEIV